MIHVAIVAPTAAVRAGLAALLQGDASLLVARQAAGLAGISGGDEPPPDVLIYFPGEDPGGLSQERGAVLGGDGTAYPTAILVVTDDPQTYAAIRASASTVTGALLPDAAAEELQAAVRALAEGLAVGSPYLLEKSFEPALPAANPAGLEDYAALTPRELEILQLLSRGLANKQIADALKISPHTVKFHIGSIYQKMGATNRAEAVRLGIVQGRLTL